MLTNPTAGGTADSSTEGSWPGGPGTRYDAVLRRCCSSQQRTWRDGKQMTLENDPIVVGRDSPHLSVNPTRNYSHA